MTISSTENTPAERLLAHWDDFISEVTKIGGNNIIPISNRYLVMGTINFPATGNALAAGTDLVWGIVDYGNKGGTIFITHYGNLPQIWVIKVGTGTSSIKQITTSNI